MDRMASIQGEGRFVDRMNVYELQRVANMIHVLTALDLAGDGSKHCKALYSMYARYTNELRHKVANEWVGQWRK